MAKAIRKSWQMAAFKASWLLLLLAVGTNVTKAGSCTGRNVAVGKCSYYLAQLGLRTSMYSTGGPFPTLSCVQSRPIVKKTGALGRVRFLSRPQPVAAYFLGPFRPPWAPPLWIHMRCELCSNV